MPAPRRILVVDPDPDTAAALAPALRRRGFEVQAARDGGRALELAILRSPDLVLLDDRSPLLDARTFLRILRTNPRTERIPVVLTGDDPDPARGRLGGYLRRPLQVDDAVAHVEGVLRRVEAARAGGDAELSGSLAQVPLPDLLQILAVNRRTGRLEVSREGERAEIALVEGRVVDAAAGPVGGEKALYRTLAGAGGQFAFVPGRPAGPERIARRIDELVLEGVRQADEVARLRPGLPAPRDLVGLLVAPAALPADLHPVTAEVAALLAAPRPLQEVLDRAQATDLEALRAVAVLLERGWARSRARAPAAAAGPAVLEPPLVHALRLRAAAGRPARSVTARVVLAGGGPLARRAAIARWAALPGFAAEPGGAPVAFGTVGALALGDGLTVDVVALPGDPALAPLWGPFAAGALGVLLLAPADGVARPLAALQRAAELPVVACGPDEDAFEPALRRAAGAAYRFAGADPGEALRALLSAAAGR
jgi:DNA-binding response OmpR family regulator